MERKIRKPNRLRNFDYAQNGAYFITLCVNDRLPILSSVTVGANCVRLTEIGGIVDAEIKKLDTIYTNVFVDNYVIMPNHVHLLIRIDIPERRTQFAPTIGRIIKQFKGSVSKQIGRSIWQKNYYDHIIRDQCDYQTKWQYIDDNPIKWWEDELYQKSLHTK
ncbi:MAG: transposase [Eubacterium sp.]